MTRIAKINVAAIRKELAKFKPTTDGEKSTVQVLKKQLTNYEKYEKSGEEPQSMENLKPMILASVAKLKASNPQ